MPRNENSNDQLAWRKCFNFETACELTAEWLEGRRHYQPGYMAAQPAPETGPITQPLADINRRGFMTTESQPGEMISDGQGQRAYVTGLCSEETAGLLSAILAGSELVSIWFPPGSGGTGQVCVTIDDHKEVTHLGRSGGSQSRFEEYRHETNESLARMLTDLWELHIFDPVWGRNSKLLHELTIAVGALSPE